MFNVSHCNALGGYQDCISSQYFQPTSLVKESCITFNYDGRLKDSWVYIDFVYKRPSSDPFEEDLFVTIHDSKSSPLTSVQYSKTDLKPFRRYEITYEKKVLKRLSYPYSSNCVNEIAGDKVPGSYTRFGCMKSNYDINMFKHCGDVHDFDRQFIPDDIKQKYSRRDSIDDTIQCIRGFTRLNFTSPKMPMAL